MSQTTSKKLDRSLTHRYIKIKLSTASKYFNNIGGKYGMQLATAISRIKNSIFKDQIEAR